MKSRTATMFLCSELVKVCCRSSAIRFSKVVTANMEEISRTGATLVSDSPLPAGAEVDIVCQNRVLRGKTTGWTADELGYTTWVEFELDSQWGPEWFRPRHLLDVGALRPEYSYVA